MDGDPFDSTAHKFEKRRQTLAISEPNFAEGEDRLIAEPRLI